ncbi:MAG: flavodoxin [Tissierellia bacterium]|nr:flavodoxin [Tissierellia bacterium]
MKKVVYFSISGRTKRIAQKISDIKKASLYEIRAQKAYTKEDLNYRDKNSRVCQEMNDENSKVDIIDDIKDFDQIDTFYIGFPIWWGICPRVVDAFLNSHDFSDKKIVLFATSGGSGFDYCKKRFQRVYPKLNIIYTDILNEDNIEDELSEVD